MVSLNANATRRPPSNCCATSPSRTPRDNPATAPRTVRVVLSDGDGGTSAPVTTTIGVERGQRRTGARRQQQPRLDQPQSDRQPGHAGGGPDHRPCERSDSAVRGIAVTCVVNAQRQLAVLDRRRRAAGPPSARPARPPPACWQRTSSTYVRFVPNADWSGTVSQRAELPRLGREQRAAGREHGRYGGQRRHDRVQRDHASAHRSPVTATNTAPTLTGANDARRRSTRTPAGNAGTLVSALIAGHISDADPGALTGIAVTAVDNSNGSWQYTRQRRRTWTDFGTPRRVAARLLAADAQHPRALRAERRLERHASPTASPSAPGTRPAAVAGEHRQHHRQPDLLDTFSVVSYANNNGSLAWTSDWIDIDGQCGGWQQPRSRPASCRSRPTATPDFIHRGADLAGASTRHAELRLHQRPRISGPAASRPAGVERRRLDLHHDCQRSPTACAPAAAVFSIDISAWASADTRIRFDDRRHLLRRDNCSSTTCRSRFGSAGGGVRHSARQPPSRIAARCSRSTMRRCAPPAIRRRSVSTRKRQSHGGDARIGRC